MDLYEIHKTWIVRDGEKLIKSAKAEVEGLLKNKMIEELLVDKEPVKYDDDTNTATVTLKKEVTELSGISGTGVMTSIDKVFTDNPDLEKVELSFGKDKLVTINKDGIELAKIKEEIVRKLGEGIKDGTSFTLKATGKDLPEDGVVYTVNFKVTEQKPLSK